MFTGLLANASSFPNKPITLIVPYAAGGGTDAVGRVLASEMEKSLGQPVNVVNRTGGNGVAGTAVMATAKADGYTLGVITVEQTQHKTMGLLSYDLLEVFAPLALVNRDSVSVFVSADSPYKSLGDLISASRDKTLVASGAATGGIYHLALAGMLLSVDLEPSTIRWVPSNGAMPALQDLVSGGIQAVAATLPEARSLVEAGRVRPLAIMASERSSMNPDVPTLKESVDSPWVMSNWRGIVAPKGVPAEVAHKLADAVTAAVRSEAYQDFLEKRGFGGAFADSTEFGELMLKSGSDLTEVAKTSGIAK